MSAPTPALVCVIWTDAWAETDSFSTRQGVQQTHRPMIIRTLGWLLHDDTLGVSVANERSAGEDGETFRGRTFIPRGMIQTVEVLRLSAPRRARATAAPEAAV